VAILRRKLEPWLQRTRAFHEELDPRTLAQLFKGSIKIWRGKRIHREQPLARDTKRCPAGGQQLQRRASAQEMMSQVCHAIGKVLAIVEHEEKLPLAQQFDQRRGTCRKIRDGVADRLHNRRRNLGRVVHRCQLDPADTIGEGATRVTRYRQRHPRLANTARTSERQQRHGFIAQESVSRSCYVSSTKQSRSGGR
jgi:hypothetical protein